MWIVWMGQDPIESDEEAMYSRWNGTSWDPPATVNPPNQTPDRFPQIGVAPDGTVWCLWAAPVPPLWDYRGLLSRWTGSGWTWPDTVWTGGDRYDIYRMTPAAASDVWIGRSGYAGGSRDVFLYHWLTGSVVSDYHYAEPDSDEAHATIAIDQNGIPWATWYQQPPISPPQTRLQVTRFIGGAWEPPQRLEEPVGTENPFIRIGPDNVPWIVCLARDPVNGYQGKAAWATRWDGQAWAAPLRISDAIASNDSAQFQLSLSRNPGAFPRAVWGRRSKFSASRTDVMTSAWAGSLWTPPEVVGNLADSAFVEHPDVAARGDTIWVAYMRQLRPSALWHSWTTHTPMPTTDTKSVDFEAAAHPDGIELRWHLLLDPNDVRSIRAVRAVGLYGAAVSTPPSSGLLVFEDAEAIDRIGAVVDRPAGSPTGEYSYWLETRLQTGESLWSGPRGARFPSPVGVGLIAAVPNPTAGTGSIRGRLGVTGASSVQIFDPQGRLVRTLRLGPEVSDSGGAFSVTWDGRTDNGAPAASGVYLARLIGVGPLREGSLRIVLMR